MLKVLKELKGKPQQKERPRIWELKNLKYLEKLIPSEVDVNSNTTLRTQTL